LERATGAVGQVARRVPGAAAFPLGLLALVGGFLLVQHFIDRGDPKLALAPSSSQTRRQFGPPPAANPA